MRMITRSQRGDGKTHSSRHEKCKTIPNVAREPAPKYIYLSACDIEDCWCFFFFSLYLRDLKRVAYNARWFRVIILLSLARRKSRAIPSARVLRTIDKHRIRTVIKYHCVVDGCVPRFNSDYNKSRTSTLPFFSPRKLFLSLPASRRVFLFGVKAPTHHVSSAVSPLWLSDAHLS